MPCYDAVSIITIPTSPLRNAKCFIVKIINQYAMKGVAITFQQAKKVIRSIRGHQLLTITLPGMRPFPKARKERMMQFRKLLKLRWIQELDTLHSPNNFMFTFTGKLCFNGLYFKNLNRFV